jgi:outer membrane lipoprotein carrier protein
VKTCARLSALACLFAVLFYVAAARAERVEDVVRALEMRYKSEKTLRAVFVERYQERGRDARTESGTVYFKRPGRMRWEYETPETKLFVADGKNVWFYVPGDRTVLRSPENSSSDWRMPFALLVRSPRVSKLCRNVSLGAAGEAVTAGNAVLHCVPRGPEAQSSDAILLEVNPATGDLSRVVVHGAGGVEIEFRFGQWVRDPAIRGDRFEFHAPAGVAIVEAEPPS